MTDGPPPRHLHPVEPPYDPAYDGPPPPDTGRAPATPPANGALADRDAEQALLATLVKYPDHAPAVHALVDTSDLWWPIHQKLWTTWADLNQADGVPPDSVLLTRACIEAKDVDAVRLVTDLTSLDPRTVNPLHAERYAKIVRDHARLRVVDDLRAGLDQLVKNARADTIEHTLGEGLQRLDDAVMRFGPTSATTNSGLHDLSWVLDGTPPAIDPPTWVHHDSGHALFYAGKVNGVFGDPETAKTWLAQCAVIEALNAGGTAAMVDVDHNGPNHTSARLLLLGAHPTHIADPDRFRYYEPEDADQLRAAVADITLRRPDVVLVDSLGEVFPMLGMNTNDGDEITHGLRLISRPADTGSCVIFIDHLPKSAEARASGFAIGSIAKKRAIRGSYIRAEESTKPAPGQVGRINLYIEKDTSGELRKATPGGKYIGKFVLDSTQPHITTWSVVRDEIPTGANGQRRYTQVMERVSRHIEDNDQCTGRDIKDAVGGNSDLVGKAIKALIDEGFVSVHQGARRAMLHHSISLYREAEDDQAQ